MMGSRKAAVLPVPVAAVPMTSLPASAGGMAWAWMGVGCSKPARVERLQRLLGEAQLGEGRHGGSRGFAGRGVRAGRAVAGC